MFYLLHFLIPFFNVKSNFDHLFTRRDPRLSLENVSCLRNYVLEAENESWALGRFSKHCISLVNLPFLQSSLNFYWRVVEYWHFMTILKYSCLRAVLKDFSFASCRDFHFRPVSSKSSSRQINYSNMFKNNFLVSKSAFDISKANGPHKYNSMV